MYFLLNNTSKINIVDTKFKKKNNIKLVELYDEWILQQKSIKLESKSRKSRKSRKSNNSNSSSSSNSSSKTKFGPLQFITNS